VQPLGFGADPARIGARSITYHEVAMSRSARLASMLLQFRPAGIHTPVCAEPAR